MEEYSRDGQRKQSSKEVPIYPCMSYKSWRFIPWPVFLDGNIEKQFKLLRDFTPKDNAVLLCSPWKSGTHWVYEIISMLLKQSTVYNGVDETIITIHVDDKTETELLDMSDKQFFHSHFPLNFQSKKHKENGGKIICFNRNPKDRHVSFFNWFQGKLGVPKNMNWNDYFTEFVLKDDLNTGWFNYTKEMTHAVESKSVNTHYMTYETLALDTKHQVVELARFLEVPYTNAFIDEIISKCSFDNMKKHISSASFFTGLTNDFRKGRVGDWKNWFTVAQNEQFDAIYAKQMRNTNVEFIFES